MTEKQTPCVLKFTKKDYKRLQKGLHMISEFRNQITLDDKYVFSKQDYENHCKETIKVMGECNYFLNILSKITDQYKVSFLKNGADISSIQMISLSK